MSVFVFLVNSILLGIGLAMDAFSVSIANGLHDPGMKGKERGRIAGTFGGFQFIMPLAGWMFVHFLLESFSQFQKWIPWIALALLLYIGGKMIIEAFSFDEPEGDLAAVDRNAENKDTESKAAEAHNNQNKKTNMDRIVKVNDTIPVGDNARDGEHANEKMDANGEKRIGTGELIIQGIATSIDALSVGFTIADYDLYMAFICALIIAVVTFIICEIGLSIGIKVGAAISKKASVLGGIILIFIGLEIFLKSIIPLLLM